MFQLDGFFKPSVVVLAVFLGLLWEPNRPMPKTKAR